MFTIFYKGQYIHGYCDRPECYVHGLIFKTLTSAKRFITRKG